MNQEGAPESIVASDRQVEPRGRAEETEDRLLNGIEVFEDRLTTVIKQEFGKVRSEIKAFGERMDAQSAATNAETERLKEMLQPLMGGIERAFGRLAANRRDGERSTPT